MASHSSTNYRNPTSDKPQIPRILQWNACSLSPRLPDLRTYLLSSRIDILAIQEPNTDPANCRLSPYVAYYSSTKRKDNKPRSVLFVRAGLPQSPVDLSAVSNNSAEYTAVSIRYKNVDFTVVSVYVPPSCKWDVGELYEVKRRSSGHLILCGDFNAHNKIWGDRKNTRRGSDLDSVTSSLHLEALNDGTETFVRHGVRRSVLDLTFLSPDIPADWNVQADSWGSDHVPIMITSKLAKTTANQTYREVRVTNWDAFRLHMDFAMSGSTTGDTSAMIARAIQLSTKTIRVPYTRPVPDLMYLNLRAARRRAQRRARKTDDPADWTLHRKIDAKFRRYTKRLQRLQWNQLCESFGSPSGISRAWRIVRVLKDKKHPEHPVAGLAIALGRTTEETAELLADAFAAPIRPPQGYTDKPPVPIKTNPFPEMDLDFTTTELDIAFRHSRRRTAPGPDGITFQALRNLSISHRKALLKFINHIWRTAEIPTSWLTSVVIPIRKPGKSVDRIDSYRPISLTSCVGKLMERLVLARLTWLFESKGALPNQLCGFRRGRCTFDAIADLASTLEEARATHQTVYCVFLDICKAFDSLPHHTILHQLARYGIAGRTYNYISAFLNGRTLAVRILGCLSTCRSVTQGVPQGSVLSPFLFNLAMADLVPCIDSSETSWASVHMTIYADDVAIWCVGPSRRSRTIGKTLQKALDSVTSTLEILGLSLSTNKTAFLCYRPGRHPNRKVANTPTIKGMPIQRVSTYRYLGMVIDDHVTWKPEITRLLKQCTKLLTVLRHFHRQKSGLPPQGLLVLYRGLILSRMLYSLPIVTIRTHQMNTLERFHRVALRQCLGLPRFAGNTATLVEAQDQTVAMHIRVRAMNHITRMHGGRSAASLLANLEERSDSQIGRLVDEFNLQIGPPGHHYDTPAPYVTQPPYIVEETLPYFPKKDCVPAIVGRSLAADQLTTKYTGWLQVFTDGSTNPNTATSTAAFVIPDAGIERSHRLNFATTSTTAELAALAAALDALRDLTPCKTVILSDSRSALCNLDFLDKAPFLAQCVADKATKLSMEGWQIAFQWIPSHMGINGNERADVLATKAHQQEEPSLFIPRYSEARRLIKSITRMRHPHPGIASGTPPSSVPESKLTRQESTLLHRLRANCAYTSTTLHKISRSSTPNCVLCNVPEDIEHILLKCPRYDQARLSLLNTIQSANPPLRNEILFPTGGRRRAEAVYRSLLEFLRTTGLAARL